MREILKGLSKKGLALSLAVFFGLFGLSCNATSYNFTSDGTDYTPNSIIFSEDTALSVLNYQCDYDDYCRFSIMVSGTWQDVCFVEFNQDVYGGLGVSYCDNIPAGDYLVGGVLDHAFTSITLSDGAGEGGGAGEGDGDGDGTLLPNGVSDLVPAIGYLSDTVDEFILYVVYVGLGVIMAVIGFFAIKWLIRFVNVYVISIFSKKK